MPRKTEWIHRIEGALEELHALPSAVIDRATLQKILHVSPRQALRILWRLAAFPAGKSLLIDRLDLISKLETVRRQGDVEFEVRRREHLDLLLENVRQELAARRVKIPAPPDVGDRKMANLPEGIHLQPGELRIEFKGAEDLLRHLLELSQAIMNDFSRFQEAVEG